VAGGRFGGAAATVEVGGGVPKWGEPGAVGRVDRIALRGEVVEGGLDVYGLPQHNDVDHDAEAVELVFLPDLVVPPQLAALAVEDGAGQGVAPLTAVEKVVDGPPVGRVGVQGLSGRRLAPTATPKTRVPVLGSAEPAVWDVRARVPGSPGRPDFPGPVVLGSH
jgi:hypothetical protein